MAFDMKESYTIARLDVSEECDGMFLLWDSLEHMGLVPSDREVFEHIKFCDSEDCYNAHSHLLN